MSHKYAYIMYNSAALRCVSHYCPFAGFFGQVGSSSDSVAFYLEWVDQVLLHGVCS
jgi:hypothetical protein